MQQERQSNASFFYQYYLDKDLDQTSNDAQFHVVVSCASGHEFLLFQEVENILSSSNANVEQGNACVEVCCSLKQVYELCLWSRLAEQVLIKLADLTIVGKDQKISREFLYEQVKSIPWENIFPECPFSICP